MANGMIVSGNYMKSKVRKYEVRNTRYEVEDFVELRRNLELGICNPELSKSSQIDAKYLIAKVAKDNKDSQCRLNILYDSL